MTTVVDASVAIKFSVEERGTAAALRLLAADPDLVAPDLILTEAANAYWSMVRSSRLLVVHAEQFLEELPGYFTTLHLSGALIRRAFMIAFQLKHPVYDCVYVALAKKLGCRVVTADRKFFLKASERFPVDLLEMDDEPQP